MKKPTTSSSRGLTDLAIEVTIATVIGATLAGGLAPFLVLIGLAFGLERTRPARRRTGFDAVQSHTPESNGAP